MQEKSKIEIAGYCLIALGILDFLLSWIGFDLTGFAVGPLILGVIGGVLLFTANQQAKAAALQASFERSLDEGETLLKSGSVSVKESRTKAEQGLLFLTNRKLVYSATGVTDTSDAENPSMEDTDCKNDFQLLLGEILSVETSLLYNLIIKDKKQNKYLLQAFGKNKWKDEILKVVSEAG
jgi:hypothetical protein